MKMIPYGHQWIDEKDIEEVMQVLRSDWITQGPKIKEFEVELGKYTGAKYAVAVSSGTAALHIACLSAGIKPGDEVITSPLTFVASANCVLYCGGKPVFADIQEDTVNINPEEIRKKISKKTKAIIPIHFAGHPADLEEIRHIAKKSNLLIIEDAAHGLGAEYKGSRIGSCKYSDMTIFSFHPVKSITAGEGGVVLTNKKTLYENLLMLRNHGITKNKSRFTDVNSQDVDQWYYEQQLLGFNYRITDLQCALGVSQLKKIDKFLKKRRKIVNIYNKEFSNIDEIILPIERPYANSSWHIYYIRLKDHSLRRKVFNKLRQSNIGVQVHYIPVYLHPYYKNLGYEKRSCPRAEDFFKKEITIPLFHSMKDKEIEFVVDRITRAIKDLM